MKMGIDYIGAGVGGLIINSRNEILLLLRKYGLEKGKWALPGGKIKFGERVEDALNREINEELGVNSDILNIVCVVNHIEFGYHYLSPVYTVKLIGDPINAEPNKHSELKWFSIYDLPENKSIVVNDGVNDYIRRLKILI